MSSMQKTKIEDDCHDPETESETDPLVHSFELSGSEANRERKDPQGSVDTDSHHRSLSDAYSSSPDTAVPYADTSAINIPNHGNYDRLRVGDIIIGNRGITIHNSIKFLVQQLYTNAQEGPATSTEFRSVAVAIIYIEATQQILRALFESIAPNSSTSTTFEQSEGDFDLNTLSTFSRQDGSEGKITEGFRGRLIKFIKSVEDVKDDSGVTQALRDHLGKLWSELYQASHAEIDPVDIESFSLYVASILRLFLFVNQMEETEIVIEEVKNRIKIKTTEVAAPDLPRVKAAYNDYVSGHQTRISCLEGTRRALLKEMGRWAAYAETNMFTLSGLAGIGKFTIAQTIAERADRVGLLGASFFFSRDVAERRTAEKFFTTIASQLCVYDPEFGSAIGSALETDRGAITGHPMVQLQTLILEPLENLVPRTLLLVVGALDECDEGDRSTILIGLQKLTQSLPSFKVVLTTCPQEYLQHPERQTVFGLRNINDDVDDDIRRYLKYNLSREAIQDRFRDPVEEWAASDDEIEKLVKVAGQLFIIASTSVLFALDKHNPGNRMKELLEAISHGRTPFDTLNNLYAVILRGAVPERSSSHLVERYQKVIGAIMLIRTPLPIEVLEKLICSEPEAVRGVLSDLRSVIFIGDANVPRVAHKSFPDYIHDPVCCTAEDLRIDLKSHHTRMTINCFRMMNQRLRQNILDLGDTEQFIFDRTLWAEDQFRAKIPSELSYACTYWANHVEGADIEDQALVDSLGTFANKHLLHWLEALSWIQELGSAYRSLLVLQKQLPTSSDLGQLVADGLRFVPKFYELIEAQPMHVYHSALPFTPTETCLYKRYSKEMTFCQVQGGPEKWDAHIVDLDYDGQEVDHVTFSPDGKMFACHAFDKLCPAKRSIGIRNGVRAKFIRCFEYDIDQVGAITNDFSKAAVARDRSIMLHDVTYNALGTTINTSATVVELALSPDGSRLVAGQDDGTVDLWDTEQCKRIESFGGWQQGIGIAFSSDGARIAFACCDGVKLLDGRNGKSVADLTPGPIEERSKEGPMLMFSGDGTRLACFVAGDSFDSTLLLWRSEDGSSIGMVKGYISILTISTDGSLLATSDDWGSRSRLQLWSGNNLELLETLDFDENVSSVAISRSGLLGIGYSNVVALYDISKHTFIGRLPFDFPPLSLAFSPDSTCLAVGCEFSGAYLCDVNSITASYASSQDQSRTSEVELLAFSPDCSRLVSGHKNGTIKLWDTSNPIHLIAVHYSHHGSIATLVFSVDGRGFASGSEKGIIQLWNSNDGALNGALECSGKLKVLSLSSSTLAAATEEVITLYDLDTRAVITTLDQPYAARLTFSHHNRLLAVVTVTFTDSGLGLVDAVTLWDMRNHSRLATHKCSSSDIVFSHDDSRLVFRPFSDEAKFVVLDIHTDKVSGHTDLSLCPFRLWEEPALAGDLLGICPRWNGVLVWPRQSPNPFIRRNVWGQFPQERGSAVVLWTPNEIGHGVSIAGSSMIALGCEDGRVLIVKAV